jgi:plasmid stabilization system protein ParE
MAKLIWSPKATADLEEICEYISRDSEHYAKLFAQRVVAVVETIAEFPMAGRIVSEYRQDDLRERMPQSYRIVYRVKPEVVEIVAIVHGARLLPELE